MIGCDVSGGCGGPAGWQADGLLVVHSAVGHTRREVARLTTAVGARVQSSGTVLRVAEVAPDVALASLDGGLSSPELNEARGVVVAAGEHDRDPFELALHAVSLARLVGQVRYRGLLASVRQPDRLFSRYQPVVDLATGVVVAFEALLRLREGEDEVSGGVLFDAADEAGFVNLLDRLGRETALRDAEGWLGDRQLFINFVPTSIYRPEVCLATTMAAAERHGIARSSLVFEVVETHQVDDVAHLLRVVRHYRDNGSRVALDDVGAGFASLNLVAEVAPDVVKIDQQLVQRLPDPVAVAVIRALIDLTHGYGGLVLAEGVETAEQRACVRDLGADLGQGWHFGRPALPEVAARTERVEVPVLA